MKILYALPATGNGHLSRASTLYPHLSKLGSVDFLVSGTQGQLLADPAPLFRFDGISLFYKNGRLDHLRTLRSLRPWRIWSDIRTLPVRQYDWVITDFEPVTYWACRWAGVRCLHWGHQASFQFEEVPRAEHHDLIGSAVLSGYVRSPLAIGIHFKSFHERVTPPVIRESVIQKEKLNLDLITVYLPQFEISTLLKRFSSLKGPSVEIFHPGVSQKAQFGHITMFPVDKDAFDQSLRLCRLCITSGGFETPSEALFMGKRLIILPIKRHFEQMSNAMVLSGMGVSVLSCLEELTEYRILEAFEKEPVRAGLDHWSVEKHVRHAFDTWCNESTMDGNTVSRTKELVNMA